jgi:hypothetical protein
MGSRPVNQAAGWPAADPARRRGRGRSEADSPVQLRVRQPAATFVLGPGRTVGPGRAVSESVSGSEARGPGPA